MEQLKLLIRWTGVLSLLVALSSMSPTPARSAEWLPATADELQMTREPKAPGAAAIYLYTQVDRDDTDAVTYYYTRVKILTEEGRKYGNVEIPYIKGAESVKAIEARTIRPDGSVVPFDGTVYDKALANSHGSRLLAKTFTMPEVQPGCIVEYRFRYQQAAGFVFDSHWILSQDLFTRNAKYSLVPSRFFALQWSWPRGIPDGSSVPAQDHGRIRLETHDVPAFVTEELMPPENELKSRVDFIYLADQKPQNDPAKFWKSYGQRAFHELTRFTDYPKDMQRAVAQVVQPTDAPEVKLRKIYARIGQMRNTSFERRKTEEEAKREHQNPAHDVRDVWKRDSGDASDLTYLFVALARAAGFRADLALVSTRDRYFFQKRLMNPGQMNSSVVAVNLEGKDVYLDPSVPFTPFGLLPWNETAVETLRLNEDGGTWGSIVLPPASASRIERKAQLKMDQQGSLSGKLTVQYIGLEAGWRRLAERNEDDTDRKQFLEDEVRSAVPTGIEIKMLNTPDWKSADEPLVVEFDLQVPGWAAAVGKRQLMKVGLFGNEDDHTFEHSTRVQPMYFDFPYQRSDDIVMELPAGLKVASLPKNQKVAASTAVYAYDLSADSHDNLVHLSRNLTINMLLVDAKYYPEVRNFYQSVRTGDEEQIVVAP
ncbi:MAG: DUF3857 and transglutaminase domain-containing protein [Proteobacteria bacterium]|nr:DUF3857 and transglutaminase domain-containing protein [Pseudomonadota bacterium]